MSKEYNRKDLFLNMCNTFLMNKTRLFYSQDNSYIKSDFEF